MIGILIIVILILVVSFIMAFIISSRDFPNSSNLTDDPKILFEDKKEIENPYISDEIKINPLDNNSKEEEKVEDLFDDELI